MSISAWGVRFDEDAMWGERRSADRPGDGHPPRTLSDGRVPGVPLARFPRLLHATPEARAGWTLSPFGIHWQALDEDISVAGLLAGRGDVMGVGRVA